jgi:hypothetical protein
MTLEEIDLLYIRYAYHASSTVVFWFVMKFCTIKKKVCRNSRSDRSDLWKLSSVVLYNSETGLQYLIHAILDGTY